MSLLLCTVSTLQKFECARKPTYPQDLREQQRPYQLFPNEDDLPLEDAAF